MGKKAKSKKPRFIINDLKDVKKRKLSEVVKDSGLESVGIRFRDLSNTFSTKGVEIDIKVDKIVLNSFRPVTQRGMDIVEASLLYHSSTNLLKDGIITGSTTRVFLCIHPDSETEELNDNTLFLVCDGNHRVSFWKKMQWVTIPSLVLPFKMSIEDVEMFAQHQNQLQEIWNSQRNCLQLLGRLVRLISTNKSVTSTSAYSSNKGLFLSVDMCRKYFTVAKIICDRQLVSEFEKIEKETVIDTLKLSMLVPAKLNLLENNQIIKVLQMGTEKAAKTSSILFCNF